MRKTRSDVIKEINKAAAVNGSGSVNLRYWDLRGANLSGLYLLGADLEGANLEGANLSKSYLKNADLSGICLKNANLSGALLYQANLRGSNLEGADFSYADLHRADFRSIYNFKGTRFKQAFALAAFGKGDLLNTDIDQAIFEYDDLPDALRKMMKDRDALDTSPLTGQNVFDPAANLPPGFRFQSTRQSNLYPDSDSDSDITFSFGPARDLESALASTATAAVFTSALLFGTPSLSYSHSRSNSHKRNRYRKDTQDRSSTSSFVQINRERAHYAEADASCLAGYLVLEKHRLCNYLNVQKVFLDPQKSTVARILLEAGLDAATNNCRERGSLKKLRMIDFLRYKMDQQPNTNNLITFLKDSACVLYHRSGLLASKSYKAAQPYFEQARSLLDISDPEWNQTQRESYWALINPHLETQASTTLYAQRNGNEPTVIPPDRNQDQSPIDEAGACGYSH